MLFLPRSFFAPVPLFGSIGTGRDGSENDQNSLGRTRLKEQEQDRALHDRLLFCYLTLFYQLLACAGGHSHNAHLTPVNCRISINTESYKKHAYVVALQDITSENSFRTDESNI